MEQNQGSITLEQRRQIENWFQEKWKGSYPCPVCQTSAWSVSGDMVAPPLFIGGGFSLGSSTYPQVMVICGNCGHTIYFNAVMMGITDSGKDNG